jgi:hypothetical protein
MHGKIQRDKDSTGSLINEQNYCNKKALRSNNNSNNLDLSEDVGLGGLRTEITKSPPFRKPKITKISPRLKTF